MSPRTNFFSFAGSVLTAAMLGACGNSSPGTDGGADAIVTNNDAIVTTTDTGTQSDAALTDTVVQPDVINPPGDRTFVLVVNNLQLAPGGLGGDAGIDTSAVGYGFNLDNAFTTAADSMPGATMGYTGCGQPDLLSYLDPDQNRGSCLYTATGCVGGVDNQLPAVLTLASSLLSGAATQAQTALDDQIHGNKLALVVQLTGVGNAAADLVNDPQVGVSIFLAYPTFTTGCDSVAAGRQYAVSQQFVAAGFTDPAHPLLSFQGSITNGRVDGQLTGTGVLPLNLAVAGFSLSLSLNKPHVRFDIAGTSPSDVVGTNGNLGAYVPIADLITAIAAIPQAAQFASLIPSVVGQVIDIDINNVCNNEMNANPAVYGGLGIGLGLTMVSATVAPAAVAAAAPGVCGNQTATDAGTSHPDAATGTDAAANPG